MQNIPAHAVPVRRDIMPWGAEVNDAIGDMYIAQTDAGHNVEVWRSQAGVPINHRYWCFSHATLCYWLNGFAFGLATLETILADEWRQIEKKPNVGDMVLFRANMFDRQYREGTILHAARVESAVQSFGSRTRIRLSSKNGPQPLDVDCSPEEVKRVYPTTYWYEESCCGCCCCSDRTNKQYYRRISGAVGVGPFLGMGHIYI
jgi:hypothetical protein